jgi:hypothetical protein
MISVVIDKDKWYPVYSPMEFLGDRSRAVDIPDELLAEYHNAYDAFMAVQDKLEPYYKEK